MKNILLLSALFCAATLFHIQAQSAPQATPPPLAPGPLINRAPAFSQWMMSTKSGPMDPTQLNDPQAKYDQRVLVTKTTPIRREISVTADGQKLESWFFDKYQATLGPGQQDPTIVVQGANFRAGGVFSDYSKSDFSGFEWISRHNYIGVQSVQGIPCIVFHEGPDELPSSTPAAGASSANGAPAAPAQTGSTAYISLQGRLPIMLVTDTGFTLYQWQQAPTTPLTLPPNVKAATDRIQATITQAAAPPAIP